MNQDLTTYRVTGMTCGGCENSLKSALDRVAPGLDVEVSHTAGTLVVKGEHDPKQIEQAVDDAGFDFGGAVA